MPVSQPWWVLAVAERGPLVMAPLRRATPMSLTVIAEEASFVLGRQMATDWVSERLAGG